MRRPLVSETTPGLNTTMYWSATRAAAVASCCSCAVRSPSRAVSDAGSVLALLPLGLLSLEPAVIAALARDVSSCDSDVWPLQADIHAAAVITPQMHLS